MLIGAVTDNLTVHIPVQLVGIDPRIPFQVRVPGLDASDQMMREEGFVRDGGITAAFPCKRSCVTGSQYDAALALPNEDVLGAYAVAEIGSASWRGRG